MELSSKYCDYTDIFEKKNGKSLPSLHWDYDHPWLKFYGAKIPFGWIYTMSESELVAL